VDGDQIRPANGTYNHHRRRSLTPKTIFPTPPANFSCLNALIAMSQLSYARYGKDNVRLYKVDKDPKTGIHTVVEQTVRILLEGDIETS
jgi:hypothetical protein